jgi:hypothetical protein
MLKPRPNPLVFAFLVVAHPYAMTVEARRGKAEPGTG